MKRYLWLVCLLIFLPELWTGKALAGGSQETPQEQALRALQSHDYETAIKICLEQMSGFPEDYELNFLLSRAYAFSRRWDKALEILDKLAARYPTDTDVLLFRARVKSWERNYREAEAGYQEVLSLSPGNTEGLTGLAEVASWEGNYAKAVSLYSQILSRDPQNADVSFRLGRVFLWDGNYDRAREYYRKALSLDPKNEEYGRVLQTASPRWQDKFELRFEHQVETFNDGRRNYLDDRLALQLKLLPLGPLVLKANRTDRYEKKDNQYEIEFYPRLWPRAYAYLDLAYSPKAVHYPESLYLLEVYQGLLTSWEVSMGYRRMNFAARPVSIYLGSLGYYFGKYIAFFRWYHAPHQKGDAFSWTANVRRYFSDASYLYAAYGRGSTPLDIVTLEDYFVAQTRVFFAGFDFYVLQKIRLQLNYTHRNEGPLRRNIIFLGAGYRW